MINKRIFGSDINIKLKKILEARQLAASKTRGPNEEIRPSKYPDERDSFYTFACSHATEANTHTQTLSLGTNLPLFAPHDNTHNM